MKSPDRDAADELATLTERLRARSVGKYCHNETGGIYLIGHMPDGDCDRAASVIDSQASELATLRRRVATDAIDIARYREALAPFSGIGQWLFVLPRADDSPAVEFEGINNYKPVLTIGHFRAAHLAVCDDEQRAYRAAPLPPGRNEG